MDRRRPIRKGKAWFVLPIFEIQGWNQGIRLSVLVLTVLLFICFAPPSSAQDEIILDLESPVRLSNTSEMRFLEPDPISSLSEVEIQRLNEGMSSSGVPTGNRLFRIYVDLESVSFDDIYRFYRYRFYVKPHSQAVNSPGTLFMVRAQPTGDFQDIVHLVKVHVTRGNERDEGEVKLPLHSFSSASFVEISKQAKPFDVHLASPTTLTIDLTNLLDDLPVQVIGEPEARSEHHEYWKSQPVLTLLAHGQEKLEIPSKGTVQALEMKVEPNPFRALTASLYPLQSGAPHEKVTLTVKHRSGLGGRERTLQVPVNLRFVPSFWGFLIAVAIGSFLGSWVPVLIPQASTEIKSWPKAFLAALVLGLAAEGLGMLLVTGGSKFVLLGFELDPFQVLPAVLIGLLVGISGFKGAEFFETVLKKK